MKNLIDALNTRYHISKESSDDKEFYMNIYHYIHLIETTPELKNIVEKEEREFRETTRGILNDTKISKEEKQKLISKTEKFSLYCFYINLEIPIYSPINDYITDPNPDHTQDPVALILTKGIENIATQKYNIKWDKKVLNSYDKDYKSRRKNFEHSLRQLHLMLLAILEKNSSTETKKEEPKTMIPLKLNFRTGDFDFYKTKGTFSPSTQEFKILSLLLNSEDYQSDYLSLYQAIFPSTTEIRKAHIDTLTQIVRNIKERLEILPKAKAKNFNIVKNLPKVGYRLVFIDLKENTE